MNGQSSAANVDMSVRAAWQTPADRSADPGDGPAADQRFRGAAGLASWRPSGRCRGRLLPTWPAWLMAAALMVPGEPGAACMRVEPEYSCVYSDRSMQRADMQGASTSPWRVPKLRDVSMPCAFRGGWLDEEDALHPEYTSAYSDSALQSKGRHTHMLSMPQAMESHSIKDVGQRYKELRPPSRPHTKLHGGVKARIHPPRPSRQRMLAVQDLHNDLLNSLSPQGEKPMRDCDKVEEAVLVLDLDKCTFWGSDSNDLGIALQWMDRGPELVHDLYRLIFNPQVKATYSRLQERAKRVRVVIYTMRATFLVYHSPFRGVALPMHWQPEWHCGAQIFIPPEITDAEKVVQTYSLSKQQPLLEEEERDLQMSFERLLATRAVIAEELDLDALPHLVVTATPKDVEATMRKLGFPVENAYLWDDNEKLQDDARVVHVPHFDRLPQEQAEALNQFLEAHCPAQELEDALADFMLGADPADVVIREDSDGKLHYQIPTCSRLQEWPLPCLVHPAMKFHDLAARGPCLAMHSGSTASGSEGKDRDAASNGCLSPVTPDNEEEQEEMLRPGLTHDHGRAP